MLTELEEVEKYSHQTFIRQEKCRKIWIFVKKSVTLRRLFVKKSVTKGAFTENYVLQQLKTLNDAQIYYFSKENSKVEIDFLLQTDARLTPIEVKAEDNVKSKSFRQFITIDHAEKHLKGLRCSMLPYADQHWMENIPLYSVLGVVRK